MDLCHRNYAFLSVPSLAIFLNPWSGYREVTEAIRDGSITADDFYAKHGAAATKDLLSRITSHTHELKHFHDILFTPYGNRLFLLAIKAIVGSMAILVDGSWRKSKVLVPLRETDLQTPVMLRKTLNYIDEFKRALAGARMVMEASATLAQQQFVWTMFGKDHKDLLEEHMDPVPEY